MGCIKGGAAGGAARLLTSGEGNASGRAVLFGEGLGGFAASGAGDVSLGEGALSPAALVKAASVPAAAAEAGAALRLGSVGRDLTLAPAVALAAEGSLAWLFRPGRLPSCFFGLPACPLSGLRERFLLAAFRLAPADFAGVSGMGGRPVAHKILIQNMARLSLSPTSSAKGMCTETFACPARDCPHAQAGRGHGKEREQERSPPGLWKSMVWRMARWRPGEVP